MRQKKGITDAIRLSIIEEHLSGASKNSLARKYNLHSGKVIRHWMRTFGIDNPESVPPMSKKEENEEILRLKQELKEIKTKLAYQQMRADAFDMMISLAEKEFQIPVRKKSGTKP